ncbi:hypothetical protein CJ030_MR6G019617 [Morella rubra]|uniref:DUF2062 domain-containing protein n=1 Tax=Morella rubra TaxID=262757 RepID=A0A6A1VDQ5_9ROSI|nr:hypothetical protein CJ030_MR6G019617 [Morella rubra]
MAKEGSASWFHKKIVDPLLQILRRGAEPKQLAFSAALGTTLGVFPICGVTVFLCGMVIALLRSRCHAPTVMLAKLLLQLLGWLVAAPFILATLYVILLPCFKLLVHKFSPAPLSPKKQPNSPSDVRLKGAFYVPFTHWMRKGFRGDGRKSTRTK